MINDMEFGMGGRPGGMGDIGFGGGMDPGIASGAAAAGNGISVAGPVIGGILGLLGQSGANQTNIQLQREAQNFAQSSAQTQMDFQERMSNTAWQRQNKDMLAAGINPIMAYGKSSGASTPSGASSSTAAARVENALSPAVTSAMDAMKLRKELEVLDSQTVLNKMSAEAKETEKTLNTSNAKFKDTETKIAEKTIPAVSEESKLRENKAWIDNKARYWDAIQERIRNAVGSFIPFVGRNK